MEQQSIELIDGTKRRRVCSKFSSSKRQQHSVQAPIIRFFRWHETSAETPNKCQLREGTHTASEAYMDPSFSGDTSPRGVDLHNNHAYTGASSIHIADNAAVLAAEQNICRTYIAVAPGQRMNSGSSSRSSTPRTPEAAPGTTVGAGEPGCVRGGRSTTSSSYLVVSGTCS